jgi:hypothetical protein
MKAKDVVNSGLLEFVLKDNDIKLKNSELELLDIIYTDEDIPEYIDRYGNGNANIITINLKSIIEKLIDSISENSPIVHLHELKYENAGLENAELGFEFNNKNVEV